MRETTKCEGAATLEDLEQYSSGLVCLTGGDEGPVAAALMHGGESAAVTVTEKLVRLSGSRMYMSSFSAMASVRKNGATRLPSVLPIAFTCLLLATNGVRYATAYDREILDVFTAIRHHTDLEHAGRLLTVNHQRHLRDAREMAGRFSDLPLAIANTVALVRAAGI